MHMEKSTTDFVLIAAGIGLWMVGSKTFAERHVEHSAGTVGSVETLAGLGMLVYGTYRMNETWGKALGGVVGAMALYNAYEHKSGEELLPAFPIPWRLHGGA